MTTTPTFSANLAGAFAFFGAVLICVLLVWLGDSNTPWGSRWYYLIGLPAMSVLVGIVSYQVPQQPGRWTVYLCLGQLLVAWLSAGFGELIIGVLFLMALSLPPFITAIWMSRLGLRRVAAAQVDITASDDSRF